MDLPPIMSFNEILEQPFEPSMLSLGDSRDEILKSAGLSAENLQQQTNQQSSIQECWANELNTNHVETSEFAASTNCDELPEFILGFSQNQLENGVLSNALLSFTGDEQDSLVPGEDVLLPSFPLLTGNNTTLLASFTTSCSATAEIPAPSPVPVHSENKSKKVPAKVNRKRLSSTLSESSSVAAQSFTTTQNSKNGNKGTSQKKKKLYEIEDKSNPLVKRADYAHSYRQRQKEEKEALMLQLEEKKEALEKAEGKIKELEEKTAGQAEVINSQADTIKQLNVDLIDLKNAFKCEKNKNALNPHQTEDLLKSVAGVVKGACPPGVDVQVNITERLATKKGTSMEEGKIQEICAADNLRKKSCVFTFDIDEEKNQLTARTEFCKD